MHEVTIQIPDEHVDAVRAAARKRLDGLFPKITHTEGEGKDLHVVENDHPDADAIALLFQDRAEDFCDEACAEADEAACNAPDATDEERSAALLARYNNAQAQTDRRKARIARAIPTS